MNCALAPNTLVIFSSDNGGVGGYVREGIKPTGDVTDNAPLRGGKGMLYEGGIRVPDIFRWPGRIPAGTVCDQPINSVDLYPTLLAVAGVPAAARLSARRRELHLPALTSGGKTAAPRGDLLALPGIPGRAARGGPRRPAQSGPGDWKPQEYFEDGLPELYNLRTDLGQTNNLAVKLPDTAPELQARLAASAQVHPRPNAHPNSGFPPPAPAKRGKRAGR